MLELNCYGLYPGLKRERRIRGCRLTWLALEVLRRSRKFTTKSVTHVQLNIDGVVVAVVVVA